MVLLHDPQTAGLAAPLARAGARVVWRCHIGVDWEDEVTRAGWDFLRPHLAAAEAYVFSRRDYVPSWVPAGKAWIIPPSIDPFSPKNQDLEPDAVAAILDVAGIQQGDHFSRALFHRFDGSSARVGRAAHRPLEGAVGFLFQSTEVGGRQRTYAVLLPRTHVAHPPLVVVLHFQLVGVGAGFVSYSVLTLLAGRRVHPLMLVISAVFVWYFIHGVV